MAETINASDSYEDGLSLVELRAQFTDWSSVKTAEIDEARESTRYYNTVQYTAEQRRILEARKQPIITFDRTSRKIDGLVGVIQKLRNDPKAFPRTPAHEAGAELATSVLRYVLDANMWIDIERESVTYAAVHGIGVVELGLEPGDMGDPDISLSEVDPATFFYDPRSLRPDFSDARFMGVSRWAGVDEIVEIFPDVDPDSIADMSSGTETTDFDADREPLWINERKKIRLVEHWYKKAGKWSYCIYANNTKLTSGPSPFVDEKGRSICRYIAFSAFVDQDGDRYGFVRRLKGPQDAINQHRSKAMHIMNTRQLFARRGTFQDFEKARREVAKPDGGLEYDGNAEDFRIEQGAQEFLQQTQYFEDAKLEIENFGPSPAVLGTAVTAKSGRALAMMQQNGIAELGPFLGNYRAWKLRIYRAVWNAAKAHWTNERAIRVTDDEGLAQFIQVNSMQVGPMGYPQAVNQLGALDVDIVLDEGPDTTNVMGDVFDTMMSLAQGKVPIPPQAILELSPLPKSAKDKVMKMLQPPPPDPMQQMAVEAQLRELMAKVQELEASAMLKQAQAQKAVSEANMPQQMGEAGPSGFEMDMQASETSAKVEDLLASADKKRAEIEKIMQEVRLAPQKMAADVQMKREAMQARSQAPQNAAR